MNSNKLQHYGIPNMKWGVRNGPPYPIVRKGVRRSAKEEAADQKKKEARKKDVLNRRSLSDAELKRKIERIRMEKTLKELTNEDIAPGRSAVMKILSSSGKKVAGSLVTGAILYGVKAAMTGNFDFREAAAYMTPKPKSK
ncbi:hypothetical protein AALC25_00145 [Lachnospiraceae bacterium 29-84]